MIGIVSIVVIALLVLGAYIGFMAQPPVAEAGEPRVVDPGETVIFDGSASINAVTYIWHFHDNGEAMQWACGACV